MATLRDRRYRCPDRTARVVAALEAVAAAADVDALVDAAGRLHVLDRALCQSRPEPHYDCDACVASHVAGMRWQVENRGRFSDLAYNAIGWARSPFWPAAFLSSLANPGAALDDAG